jgi:hypothetical protein
VSANSGKERKREREERERGSELVRERERERKISRKTQDRIADVVPEQVDFLERFVAR